MQQRQQRPTLIFSICALPDAPWLERWEAHLRPLEQAGTVSIWSARHIQPGTDRGTLLHDHLDQADFIILLLSVDFFMDNECEALMERALARYQQGTVRLIPLLLRPVAFRETKLATFVPLPSNDTPVTLWHDHEAAFDDCVRELRRILGRPITISLAENAALLDLATTPLMLSVLLLAYKDSTVTISQLLGNARQQVFAAYVQRMLTRRPAERYTSEQTVHWLTHLAQQMKQHSQTIFSIEYMQPDWLPGGRTQRVYEWLGVRIPNCLMGVLVSIPPSVFLTLFSTSKSGALFFDISLALVGGWLGLVWSEDHCSTGETKRSEQQARLSPMIRGHLLSSLLLGVGMGFTFGLGAGTLKLGDGLRAGLSIGVTSGFACLLLAVLLSRGKTARASNEEAPGPKRSAWYARLRNEHMARGGLVGIILGLGIGIPFALLSELQSRGSLSAWPLAVLSAWLISLLLYGPEAAVLSVILVGKTSAIQPVEQLVWSWSSLWRSLTSTRHLLDGVIITLIFGFFSWLFGVSYGLILRLAMGLVWGLTFGLSYWLFFGFFQSVKGEMLDEQSHVLPNQGIYRSARNGLLFGCISGCISTFTLGLGIVLFWMLAMMLIGIGLVPAQSSVPALTTLGSALDVTWHYGLFIGLACGLLLGLLNGWLACLRHMVLRWLLWRREAVPWNYPRFLAYAAERILLRRVGGGYIFVHRLLLEYFVDVEAGATPDVSRSPTQFRVGT